ncbi:MBL fold metallo-hydrolase [Pseudoteredinibacter isoporae]|uniref:Glyoxylase-like metal-dependent hydrolase (Beta-lactamase superfamily II) n=1 Tax=Pseudoteredinibacter isoporae TaxID=570281 RepID=A0A7X0JUW2_9GAMM|nr:MBL fold metallo-hydrolase [Pseudoteredinibacter isoporae]MBB6521831.1 glyoxylase-like metal-dependent hydrolase (beta-lactamase superfamily II) [Pseudoteredinibacter isoporae]NHO87376.1 MBL fold metallo-hydrolase [Pseudoteredinibacter isoporae]NIB23200.1 MBL fold metallo-hydrolase [Pseudoteredinibacter isoporae]
MNLSKFGQLILALIALSWNSGSLASKAPLELEVYRADENSFFVASVLVKGPTEAVLIDAQFTRAHAHQLVANILRSGKTLRSIYISHGDPDYYFGLEVIQQAFPDAEVYATEATRKHIESTLQKKLDFWGPKLAANGPKNVTLPQAIGKKILSVDGQELNIIGLETHPDRTFVWIPSIKAVVGGVPIYSQVHLWIADSPTKESRQQWNNILDQIEALRPEVIVPGHSTSSDKEGLKALEFTRQYLKDYEAELAKAKNSKSLINAINKQYPESQLNIALDIGAKVATGEMTW